MRKPTITKLMYRESEVVNGNEIKILVTWEDYYYGRQGHITAIKKFFEIIDREISTNYELYLKECHVNTSDGHIDDYTGPRIATYSLLPNGGIYCEGLEKLREVLTSHA